MSKVIYASELTISKELNIAKSYNRTIKLGIETQPNNATFEALLKSGGDHNMIWTVIGDVSRLSMYKGLSDCMNDKFLRKYCSCKIL